MNNTDKLLPRERVCLMNAIAERDKLISEKDRLIAHYKRQYEIAVRQRLHERHERLDKWNHQLLQSSATYTTTPNCLEVMINENHKAR